MPLAYDAGVFDGLALLGVLLPAGAAAPQPAPKVKLVDTRIRPKLIGRYF